MNLLNAFLSGCVDSKYLCTVPLTYHTAACLLIFPLYRLALNDVFLLVTCLPPLHLISSAWLARFFQLAWV